MKPNVNVVLVHGAWADGSSWSKVIPLLQAQGFNVVAAQIPLTSLADDIAVTQRLLSRLTGPTVLVGHSYGGAVIAGAANDLSDVKALVYIAGWGVDEGESLEALSRWAESDLREEQHLALLDRCIVRVQEANLALAAGAPEEGAQGVKTLEHVEAAT